MQRKATARTRAANAQEKAFMGWVKEQACCVCGNPGPSICDHVEGATFRHNKTLVGHWFLLPLCLEHDNAKTHANKRAFRDLFGSTSLLWGKLACEYGSLKIPDEVINAIEDFNK